jgi:L-asparaginase
MRNVLLIATGGTIAGRAASAARTQGYEPGALPVAALIDSVPGLAALANVTAEQPFSIGSQHIGSTHWLALVRRVRAALADDAIDGIVITHGTDTLEETAFVLDLACPRDKPVVLTGAMRPATSIGADGPMNLHGAVALAAHPSARGLGAVVLMNDLVLAPHRAAKGHSTRIDAFGARDAAPLALMIDSAPRWYATGAIAADGADDPAGPAGSTVADDSAGPRASAFAAEAARRRLSLAGRLQPLPASLPRVDLIAQHVDADPALVDWVLARGARGIVLAGTGNGTASQPMLEALTRASAAGCVVVRASRIGAGPVVRDGGVDDSARGFVAAGFVSPHKARALTALALAAGVAPPILGGGELQALFERC